VFGHQEFILRDQSLIVRIDEVIQHFGFRALGDPDQLREFLVLESRESFGDVARSGSRSILKLFRELKSLLERGAREQPIDLQLQLIRKLPRDDFPAVFESSHAKCWSNFAATPDLTNSGMNLIGRVVV
jgi:hypothetical protein